MRLRLRDTGETKEATEGMTLGRLSSCDWPLEDASISRQHGRLVFENNAWFLEDLGSSNGSQLNGRKGRRHRLQHGDLLTLGTVAFDILDEQVAPRAAAATVATSEGSAAPAREGGGASQRQEANQERARLRNDLRNDRRSSGFGDLSQQSLWVQLLAVVLGLGVMAGIVYGIRFLGQHL